MSKITNFLNLLKGDENEYFDYVLYLNNNWDKIDQSIKVLYDRDNNVYVDESEFGAVGNALYKKVDTDSLGRQTITWWADPNFKTAATDNYSAFVKAFTQAQTNKKAIYFPKGRYYFSRELLISQITIDMLFEKGAILVGNVKIQDTIDVAFNNLTIEGNLILDSIQSCKFLNTNVTGSTKFGTTIRAKNNTLNSFVHCNFTGTTKGFEFYCDDSVANGDKTIVLKVLNNSFINCNFTAANYGIYSEVLDEIQNAEISNNIFINSKSTATGTGLTDSGMYLGKKTKTFQFIGHTSTGTNAIDVDSSLGQHSFSSGVLSGTIKGSADKFLIYKPASANNVSFEKAGNNINNMRKMKVFSNEVPKWTRFNVSVLNDSTPTGITGIDCLKITNSESLSFPTLERVFSVADHLNQPVNVIARVKAKPNGQSSSDAAVIITNGNSNDTITLPVKTDDTWKVITAKMTNTDNRNITVKLSPNNSYANVSNNLYVDWIIIALGDFVQYSSVPAEEHHYKSLTHFGDFTVNGNFYVNGLTSVNNDIEVTDFNKGIILRSPGGKRYRFTVNDAGILTAIEI